jgi:peptidoglycan/xylan/chitin deacetylase (PgdA/CDA1 family)
MASLRSLIGRGASIAPLPVLRRMRAVPEGTVTVLCYHTLGADQGGPDAWTALRLRDFRAQVDLLERHYQIVAMDRAVARMAQADRAGDKPLAVITFDDGDIGLFTHLIPFLRERPVPVTIYIATAQIKSGEPYWFDRVMNALQAPQAVTLVLDDLGTWRFEAQGGAARWHVLGALLEALKTLAPDQRQTCVAQILAQVADHDRVLGPMTVAQLQALAALPDVVIGAHSHCHNLLDQIPAEQARDSIQTSRQLLQAWTGQPINHFAYPNGNHSPALRAMTQEMGFASAVALDNGLAQPGSDMFALPRIGVGRYDPLWRVKLRLAGL